MIYENLSAFENTEKKLYYTDLGHIQSNVQTEYGLLTTHSVH